MPARKVDPIRIEYMPLSGRKAAPRNPKLHALEDIKNSIRRFGFVSPAALNETSGRMVAGHGRTDALAEMKAAGEAPPKRIVEREGEWYFPVLRGVDFDNEDEAEAYLVADNKLTELGGFDENLLAQMLQEQMTALGDDALRGLGIDEKESARLLARLESSSGVFNVGEVPPPQLKNGDRQPFRQMTFTVHDQQFQDIEAALAKAKESGGGESEVNANSNGNALAWICRSFNCG